MRPIGAACCGMYIVSQSAVSQSVYFGGSTHERHGTRRELATAPAWALSRGIEIEMAKTENRKPKTGRRELAAAPAFEQAKIENRYPWKFAL